MVFARTAASIGWQVRRDLAQSSSSSSSSSLENQKIEDSSCQKQKSGGRGKEKVKRSGFRTNQTPSKKKRTIDKDGLGLDSGEGKGLSYRNFGDNCNQMTSNKTNENYYGPVQPDDNDFIAPGVRITERSEGKFHSVVVTFDGNSHHGNRYQSIAITGTAKVMALQGNVTIFGYTLTDKSGISLALNSPSWMSSLCITPYHTNTDTTTESHSPKDTDKPVIGTLNQLPIKIKITSTISNNKEGSTFRLMTPEKVRSHIFISDRWKLVATSILNDVARYRKEGIDPREAKCHGKDPNPLPNLTDPLDVSKENQNHVTSRNITNGNSTLVCGAKGVGKSTYMRYLVNRFLSAEDNDTKCKERGIDGNNHVGRVAIIDCDVGQSELSPPGLLSLTIVTKPILSPPDAHIVCGGGGAKLNHTHSSTLTPGEDERLFDVADHHCKAYYYGYTSSKADPTSYINAVKTLTADFKALCFDGQDINATTCECLSQCGGRIPLIINTDGWVKSMGYEILSSIIGVTNPEHIVQILGTSKAKLFELSSHDSDSRQIYTIDAFGHRIPQSFQPTNATGYDSSFAEVKDFNSPVTSASLRNLSLCTYFLGGYSSFSRTGATFQTSIVDDEHTISSTLARTVPFAVPFDAVDCTHLDDNSNNKSKNFNNISDSLNCSIVGLCVAKASCEDSFECVGLGIIRGIDWQKRLFYILTPVPACKLVGRVRTLVGGHIQLPIECSFLGVKSESFSFQCCDGISVGIGTGSKAVNKK